jgi:RNA polymerase sigma-70 factor (ECF subfamily)
MTDEELAKSVQDGNKEKYRELVERYQKRLFGYINKMINQPPEEIEDVLQEVFINAYINIQSFNTKRYFSNWIYRIAHNKCVDYMKKSHLKIKIIEDDEIFLNKEKLIEEVVLEEDMSSEVYKAINKLNEKYKDVIILYYFENKTYDEISDILRIPVRNVGVSLFRAKEKLKISLKNYETN